MSHAFADWQRRLDADGTSALLVDLVARLAGGGGSVLDCFRAALLFQRQTREEAEGKTNEVRPLPQGSSFVQVKDKKLFGFPAMARNFALGNLAVLEGLGPLFRTSEAGRAGGQWRAVASLGGRWLDARLATEGDLIKIGRFFVFPGNFRLDDAAAEAAIATMEYLVSLRGLEISGLQFVQLEISGNLCDISDSSVTQKLKQAYLRKNSVVAKFVRSKDGWKGGWPVEVFFGVFSGEIREHPALLHALTDGLVTEAEILPQNLEISSPPVRTGGRLDEVFGSHEEFPDDFQDCVGSAAWRLLRSSHSHGLGMQHWKEFVSIARLLFPELPRIHSPDVHVISVFSLRMENVALKLFSPETRAELAKRGWPVIGKFAGNFDKAKLVATVKNLVTGVIGAGGDGDTQGKLIQLINTRKYGMPAKYSAIQPRPKTIIDSVIGKFAASLADDSVTVHENSRVKDTWQSPPGICVPEIFLSIPNDSFKDQDWCVGYSGEERKFLVLIDNEDGFYQPVRHGRSDAAEKFKDELDFALAAIQTTVETVDALNAIYRRAKRAEGGLRVDISVVRNMQAKLKEVCADFGEILDLRMEQLLERPDAAHCLRAVRIILAELD